LACGNIDSYSITHLRHDLPQEVNQLNKNITLFNSKNKSSNINITFTYLILWTRMPYLRVCPGLKPEVNVFSKTWTTDEPVAVKSLL
jgi:hypothetical protein